MTNQNSRSVLTIKNALGRGHVFRERRQRFLNQGDVITVLGQDIVDRPPARTANKRAMDQHDVLDGTFGGLSLLSHGAG